MNDSPPTTDIAPVDRVIRIETGSRLHFGLLRASAPFGGVGVMIEYPPTVVTVRPIPESQLPDSQADAWQAARRFVERITPIAERVSLAIGRDPLPACRIEIEQDSTRQHQGLGSGTQLSLAIAEALLRFAGGPAAKEQMANEQITAKRIIACADRGKRSAVGVHGYFHGGLIHEEPQQGQWLNPISNHVMLPDAWRVAFYLPPAHDDRVSGSTETQLFAKLPSGDERHLGEMQTCLADQLVPAAKAGNFADFADSVTRYNHLSGRLFEDVQGGAYNGPAITSLIETLVEQGARGVGQSSWGPGVFAWFESELELKEFQQGAGNLVDPSFVASPKNDARSQAFLQS